MKPDEAQHLQDEKNLPNITETILFPDGTTSDGFSKAPPKRNGGLAIKITPKKLNTNSTSISIKAELSSFME